MNDAVIILVLGATLVFGLLECFLGYRIFKVVVAVVGFMIGGALASGIAHLVTDGNTVAILVAGVVGGIVVSVLMFMLYYVAVFVMGSMLGVMLTASVLTGAGIEVHPALFLVPALIGGVLALLMQKVVIVVATSFGGASNAVVAAVLLLNREFNVARVLEDPSELLEAAGPYNVVLLACWAVLGVVGVVVQYRSLSKGKVVG